jgi:hypothetical protein
VLSLARHELRLAIAEDHEAVLVAPSFSKKTKRYLYVCPGCPQDTYSDKYGDIKDNDLLNIET